MPTKLTDTYDKAIERIQQQPRPHVTLALRVLSWISCARRPLLVEELRHGLAVEFGKPFLDRENLCDARTIVVVCGGLVTIDSESNTIRLAHFTVIFSGPARSPPTSSLMPRWKFPGPV
jgi:hypothetical protein